MTFGNGNSYNLSDPDLQYFMFITKFDREINNKIISFSFSNDMNYSINYRDKKLIRYFLLKICIVNTINNWEVDCEAEQISTSSSHLIQTN